MMMHERGVTALAFSVDAEVLASGSEDGQLKLWSVKTGACRRKIDHAHENAITSIAFSSKCLHVLTSSLDETARIHGLVSGKTLKHLRGHNAFVNAAVFIRNNAQVVTGCSDGHVRIFNVKSEKCEICFAPPPRSALTDLVEDPRKTLNLPGVVSLFHSPKENAFVVCPCSNTIYVMNSSGQVLSSMSSGKREGGNFVAAAGSKTGEWIYCAAEDKAIYCFSQSTGKLEHLFAETHSRDILGICHHPHQSVLATWSADGDVHIFSN
eukprot:Polyplicarium_translucidae@DN2994_c0_g1_i6.p1